MVKRIIPIVFGLIIVLIFASPGWAAGKPEIDVLGNGTSIASGSTQPNSGDDTLFADAFVGGTVDHVFTIVNTGGADLNILGLVTVTDDINFSVQAQPASPVPSGGGTTTFTIRFNPQSAATFQATVTIPNDDQNEGTYTFLVEGTGLAGSPVISVYGQGTLITNGASSPNAGDDTLFEDPGIGGNVDHVFTIENTGDADLTVGSVAVDDTTNFSVQAQPASPVPSGGGTTTFTIRFNPQSGGTFPATVTIPNSDSLKDPYTFVIEGTATVAAPTVDTPSVGNVQVTTADLGGNIASTGGEDATERGVYWSTTPGFTPPGQGTKVSETPGPYGIGTFTLNDVPGLNPGALNYFRAFATNSAGTGYSAEQAFQTEPALQPTGPTVPTEPDFSSVTSNSMTISWTPQSGDGSIVVVKQGGPVDVAPGDYTEHGFSSDPWNGGTDLGGGNYVVYRGVGTSVSIAGLSAATTYGVAIYAYAGSGGTNPDGVNYQQDGPLTGSQGTPAGKPTLSAPSIVGFADANSATIGATIEADGGDSVTDFGTVWGTASQPTGNSASAGSTPGGFPYSYSHLRDTPAMPAGKLIYFRGYASNSFDTGYSPDGIFYTEPNAQADGVTFSNVSFGSFTIDWSPGDRTDGYDGSIVIIKKDSAVDALPQDGNTYTADSVFESGTELGTGNWVVFSGPGTTVTVTGLLHNRTYHVAVYEYSGSGSSINYMLVEASNRGNQATPKAPSHREAYQIDCGQCHASHGVFGGSYVPRDQDQEDLCKTCHGPGGQADQKQMVKNHSGAGVTTDCGSCHEVHHADTQASPQNVLWTTDFRDSTTAENLNWIRGNPGTSYDPSYVPGAIDAEPIVFHTASSEEFARPNTAQNLNANGKLDGLCQACHTNQFGNTKYHTNDPNGPNAPTDATYGYTHPANISGGSQGQICTACHEHVNGFAPTVSEVNCLANGCHSGPVGSRRQIGGGASGDFSTTSTSHHVNDGTGSEIVTRWDCVTCHAEGDAVTGEITGYHSNGAVEMRHADGTVTPSTDTNGVYASDWAALTPAQRSEFCMSCHDNDGATIITTRTDPDPDATTNALNPFNDNLTNSHPLDGISRSSVVDVKSQFDTANLSHHAVLGQAYTSTDLLTWDNPGVRNAITGVAGVGRNDLSWTSTLSCEDCHYGSPTTKLNGHGTANSRYMLRDAAGGDAEGQFSTKTLNCHRCHDVHVNATNYDKHSGQDGNHQVDDDNIFGISCLNCHGGGYESPGYSWGVIHGVPSGAFTPLGHTPNSFTYGSAIGMVNNWTDLGSPSCGAIGSTTITNLGCTQHNAKGSTGQSYTRSYSRTYKAP